MSVGFVLVQFTCSGREESVKNFLHQLVVEIES